MEGRSELGEPSRAVIQAMFSLPELGMPVADVDGLTESAAAWVMLVGAYAWRYAGDALGLDYAKEALGVAERVGRIAVDVLRTGEPEEWGAAIAWLIAERHGLLDGDDTTSPAHVALADDLGSKPHVLAEDARTIATLLRRPHEHSAD
jgi:hypothetical protein